MKLGDATKLAQESRVSMQDEIRQRTHVSLTKEAAKVLANILLRTTVHEVDQQVKKVLKSYHEESQGFYFQEIFDFIRINK